MKTALTYLAGFLLPCLCFAMPPQDSTQGNAPPDTGNALVQAQALIGEAKNDEAIQLLKTLAAKQPEPAGVEAALGKAYYQKRDYREAANHLELGIKQKPDDADSAQLLALSYYALGQFPRAIPLLEKLQAELPHPDPTGSYLLGQSYVQTHQFDQARAAFATLFSVPSESAQARLVLGQMLMHQNLEDQAASELKQAIAMDPRLPMAHFLLGEVHLYRSRVQDALEEFDAELRLNPLSWLAYWRIGDAYTRLGRWNEAERALKQAIWLDQTFTGPYILLGKVELKKDDPVLAAGFLEHALKMDPNNFYAHYLLGQAYRKLGRSDEADRQFELSGKLRGSQKPEPE